MVSTPTGQLCAKCQTHKPEDAFHPGKRGKAGHYCKACAVDYKRRWREARAIRYPRAPRPPRLPKQPTPRKARTYSTTYRAVHRRVHRERGPAAEQACAHCAGQAHHWAYDHTDPRPLVGTTPRGIVAEYSADVTRYIALCRRCHSIFDRRT